MAIWTVRGRFYNVPEGTADPVTAALTQHRRWEVEQGRPPEIVMVGDIHPADERGIGAGINPIPFRLNFNDPVVQEAQWPVPDFGQMQMQNQVPGDVRIPARPNRIPPALPVPRGRPSDVVGDILGKSRQKLLNRPSEEWILIDTIIGIEVELEGVGRLRGQEILPEGLRHYWNTHEDGSLHDGGVEFSFKNPMFGEDAKEALQGLLVHAQREGWRASLRTGIHIHMDARDLSRHQLLGLLAYYTLFEPYLYAWVARRRDSNNFCIPWYKYSGALKQTGHILEAMKMFAENEPGITEQTVLAFCNNYHRYAGLNLKALAEFGSIEFRQLETSLDYREVRDWINILMALKKAALEVPESTAAYIVNDVLRHGVQESAEKIFGGAFLERALANNPQCVEEVAETAIPSALELIAYVNERRTQGAKPNLGPWNPKLTPDETEEHPGFIAWRKANFPKDVSPPKEQY